MDKQAQGAYLQQAMDGVTVAWEDPALKQTIGSFDSFCEALGFGPLPQYFASHGFAQKQDWAAEQLDEEGQALQSDISNRAAQLPFRLTKSLLGASTEKIDHSTKAWEISTALWERAMPTILPNLLELTRLAHSFNDLQNWSHLPEELRAVMARVLVDRFWQAGISSESKDDFYARVSSSKSTYEGFASTIRGSLRQVRESCYWILCGLSHFKHFFYGIPELAGPLSEALYSNAAGLSVHHCTVLLSMSTQLIETCPPYLRFQFLPPIVSGLFRQLDNKMTTEWDTISRRSREAGEGDNLGDEMKTESILRSLTYNAVMLLYMLLDVQRPGKDSHFQRIGLLELTCQIRPSKTVTLKSGVYGRSRSPTWRCSRRRSYSARTRWLSVTRAPAHWSSASSASRSLTSETTAQFTASCATMSLKRQSHPFTILTSSTSRRTSPASSARS